MIAYFNPVNIMHGMDSGWTRADLSLPHSGPSHGWAEGGKAQVHPKYLGLPTFLLGRARLGMSQQLIEFATAMEHAQT